MNFRPVVFNDRFRFFFASTFPGHMPAAASGIRRTHRLARSPRNELHQRDSFLARFDSEELVF